MHEAPKDTQTPSEKASPAFAIIPTSELTREVRKVWLDEVVPMIETEIANVGERQEIVQRMDRGLSAVLSRLTVLMEER